jgi:hypothetical protein
MTRPTTDHIVASGLFRCLHCGSSYAGPDTDTPVDAPISVIRGFALMHKHCQPKPKPSPQLALPQIYQSHAIDERAERELELLRAAIPLEPPTGCFRGIDGNSDPETDPPGPPKRHGEGPLMNAAQLRHLVTRVRPKEFWPSVEMVTSWHADVRADVQRWCQIEHKRSHPIAGMPVPFNSEMPNVLQNIEFERKPKRGARPLSSPRKRAVAP